MSVPVSVSGPDIETLLAAHDGWDYGGPGVIECEGCGWKSERLGPEWNGRKGDRHRAHVAAVLRAHIATAQADAWDEGFDAGDLTARAVNPEWPEPTTNPYRAALVGQIGADHD